MKTTNIFENIPTDLSNETLEQLVDSENIKIERIISKGHKSPEIGWYDQDQGEWVLVLQGEAIILFENEVSVTLKSGDHLNIKPHQKHKVAWTDPEIVTIWLAVHY